MHITIDLVKSLVFQSEVIVVASSNSMLPRIKKGDKIILKREEFSKVREEDIIAFHIADRKNIIVHRVVRKVKDNREDYFITKGDNNLSEDPWIVTKKNFLGKVEGTGKKKE